MTMAQGKHNGVLRQLRRVALRHDGAGLTDAELLECYLTWRGEDAFASLLQRHGPMVLGVCRRVLRNEADAHDAFQATFLVFVRKAASIRHRQLLGNWLYGVAHKTALKAKALDRRRRAKERQAALRPAAMPPDDAAQELLARLDEALGRLPDKYRVPIVLCDLEGKPLKEAARQLGCPQGTVASRLARAREKLARRLACSGVLFSGAVVGTALVQGTMSACVPVSLMVSTVQAATAIAAGNAATAGMISTEVVALTEGVVKAMRMTKLRTLTTVVLAVTLLGGGGGLLTYRTLGAERPSAPSLAAGPDKQAGAAQEVLQAPEPPSPEQLEARAKEEKAKSDKQALQGTWVAVSGEQNGEKVPKDKLEGFKLIFTDEKVAREGYEPREGPYTIDPNKDPKEIDLFTAAKTWKGIYELKGTTLKLVCKTDDRPTEFDSSGGKFLIVFEKK
jgi:RNA polymerase sigma factor (sigma-70 family)